MSRGEERTDFFSKDDDDRRIVLLLDLDCFYAQAACVRLGLDASSVSLAVLQWNSVLAVTYPARSLFGIKRGDSWETVRQKSDNRCHTVHVPILKLPTNNTESTNTSTERTSDEATKKSMRHTACACSTSVLSAVSSFQDAEAEYKALFQLTSEQQQACREAELGVRHYSHQGKACIELYRIASAMIFATVQSFLKNNKNVILERASIDEFFLDVTAAVDELVEKQTAEDEEMRLLMEKVMNETIEIGKSWSENSNKPGVDMQQEHCCSGKDIRISAHDFVANKRLRRWQWGCCMAYQIRQFVYEQVGFTMTAGIGPNKTLAKLAASYGKPNGQAVCFHEATAHLLEETQISSCRGCGGKLGAMVQSLLPTTVPTTMGSIARHLSLSQLRDGLRGSDADATARWVYNLARGIDKEPVQAKNSSSVLTKSITAFKSLNFAPPSSGENPQRGSIGHTLEQAIPWIQLLAEEVVTRVERDARRNHRYPRLCNIQYATSATNANKSIRVSFPASRLMTAQKIAHFVTVVPQAIRSNETKDKRGSIVVVLHRVGLCATDFATRGGGDGSSTIESYFGTAASAKRVSVDASSNNNYAAESSGNRGSELAVKQQDPDAKPMTKRAKHDDNNVDLDLKVAKKLQALYDRENRSMEVQDSSKAKRVSVDAHASFNNCAAESSGSTGHDHDVQQEHPSKPITNQAKHDDNDVDLDLKVAQKLQAMYDREKRAIEVQEERKAAERRNNKCRIDNFFLRKSK